ncbi:MAG: hypothetical protein OHK0029_00870 [Armatimonadaceae bacterium]
MEETQKLPPPVTMRDLALILRRRAPLALFTFVIVVAATLFATSKMRTVYEAKSRILIDRPTDYATPSSVMDLVIGKTQSPLNTEIEKLRARKFLEAVLQKAGLTNGDPDDLNNRLKLAPVGDQILEIQVRAETAEEAQELANTTAELYIASARVEYDERVDETQRRMVRARTRAQEEKNAADLALGAFNKKLGVSDPTILFRERASLTVTKQRELEEENRNLSLQQARLKNLYQQIQNVPREIENGYSLNKNPVIDGYKTELYALEVKRKQMLFDYAPDSEEVRALDVEIRAKKNAIAAAEKDMFSKGSRGISRNPDYSRLQSAIIDTGQEIKNAQKRISTLEEQLGKLNTEQKRLTELQNTWEGLKRKRDIANEVYEQARSGLIKMEATGPMSAPVIKVLDSAQLPREPISPKPKLNLIMAICLGIFLGLGMALLAEYMVSGSMGQEWFDPNLPEVGGVPLLGSLPVALPAPVELRRESSGLPAPTVSSAPSLDALREIGFAIAHRHPGEPVRVVVLSATRSDETTAALAAQLTATLVRDGLRVTLVDGDRNQPRLNKVFGKPDAPGLSDVLAKRVNAADVLYVGASDNLRFMAAGSPDDPTPYTEAGLREVFKQLADDKQTDLVVVSGPSVWQVPQIAPLEKAATGMVLITPDTTDGTSSAEIVARARRLLSNGYKPRLLGVITGQSVALGEDETPELPYETREV